MDPFLTQIIFGWPLFVISVMVTITGILNKGYGLVLLGTLLIIPYTMSLNQTRTFFGFALLIPLLQLGSAWAVKDDNDFWAWVLFSPTVITRLWLLVVTWSYTSLSSF
jgi:hypothetical protein